MIFVVLNWLLILSFQKCEVDAFASERRIFLEDFFKGSLNINYNFYGCLTKHVITVDWFVDQILSEAFAYKSEQHDIERKVFDNVLFRRIHFIKSPSILKEMHVNWLVSDGVGCNIVPYLTEVNNAHMFRFPFKNLILVSHVEYEKYISTIEQYEILPTSEVVIAVFNSNEVELFSVFKINATGSIVRENYGFWTRQGGLVKLDANKSFSERRRNFQKHQIRYGTVIFKDKEIIKSNFDDIPSTPDFFFQQDMPILYSLIQSINATMEITVYDNHGVGGFNKSTGKINGNGMVRELFDEKLDLSSTMFLTQARIQVIDPVAPIDYWGLKIFLRKPSLSYVKNIYVLTLTRWVWIVTLFVTILMTGTLYVTLKWEISTSKKKNEMLKDLFNINVSDMFLLPFEALCQQGTTINSLRIPGRLQLFLLFLMFMFIYVAYSASILVLLKSTVTMNDLNHLLESRYEVGGLNQSYVKHYLQSPKTGILRQLYLKKIHPNSYFEETRGLKKVQEGDFAFFAPIVSSYKYFLKNFTNYDICSLQELPGYMNMKSYPFVPKSSGYKKIFKIWLLNIQERGIAQRSKIRVVRKPQCNNQAGNFQSVRIFDCLYVLMIYMYGVVLSLFVLCLEIFIKKYLSQRTQYHNCT